MSDYINLLITIYYEDAGCLLECALKIDSNKLNNEVIQYWAELENKEKIEQLLPLHVRSCGPIVNVKEIFEIELEG